MKKSILATIFFLVFSNLTFSQIKATNLNYVWAAKEFSKDVALFRAKSFLYKYVLGSNEKISKFELIPLAASGSGELTTLLYKADDKNQEGMILGFFGDYWNEAGVVYQGYAFKNLNKYEALEFLEKINNAIESNSKFMKDSYDNNNIYFSYKDIDVLIYASNQNFSIRLFWNNFDSNWDKTAFDRSKRRFEKRIN